VKVELENESLIKTETIIIDAPMAETKVVTIKAEKDNKGVIIVAIALAVLGFILIGVCVRQVVMKPKQQMIEMEKKI
jgi:flagellar biosynthesis/type III secretory pathway M-ring protein FliF/YscJ